MPTLRAFCDGCAAATEVPPEDLLDFEVRCGACGEGTLVLRWTASGTTARLTPPPTPTSTPVRPYEHVASPPPPPPLASGRLPGKVAPGALAGKVAGAPPELAPGALGGEVTPPPPAPEPVTGRIEPSAGEPGPKPAGDLPTLPGDDEPLDPFEAAAQKLDRSVTVAMRRARRHTSGTLERPTSSALERPTSALGGVPIEERPTRALSPLPGEPAPLTGLAAPAPPLPAWDGGDTSRVIQLAEAVPPKPQSKPVALEGGPAVPPSGPDALASAVEVIQVEAGARGTGSRTYDRTVGVAPPEESAPAPGTPAGPKIEDSDWLALIDELTEQPDSHDGPSRVFIRLPENAAPTDVASQEQVARFQATMRRLEEGGVGELSPLVQSDTPTPSAALPRGLREPETRPWEDTGKSLPRGAEDPITRPWEDTSKSKREDTGKLKRDDDPPTSNSIDVHAEDRASARAEPVTLESSGRMVKEFTHHDLDPALVCARDATSPRADAFRQLYQRIFHAREVPPRVVLITSPRPGAGKTTVASNLAVVAARIPGRGAVLVDADPRGRGVLRYFGVRRRAEGLLEALQTGGDPVTHTLQFNLGTLDVVPLGIKGSDAPELIASDRLMGDYLERLRAAYPNSVILIDGSSALQAADPLVLARLADGAVVVVRGGHTASEDVRRTLDLLGPERVLGLVFNDG